MIKHTLKVREVAAIIAAFIALVLVVCCVFYIVVKSDNDTEKGNTDKIMEVYPGLKDEDHVFFEITASELIYMLENKQSGIVIMGFPACPWCRALMPVLNDVAKENGLTKIAYLDIKDIRDNEENPAHKEYLTIKEILKDCVDKDKDRINAPTVIAVKDGVLVDYHLDTVEGHVTNENGILPEMTAEQIAELKNTLAELIKKVN